MCHNTENYPSNMKSRKRNNILSLFYIYFFVLQEFWNYSVDALQIHKLYWIVMLTLLSLFSVIILSNKYHSYKLPYWYTAVLIIGAFASVENGYSMGFCFLRALFAIISLSSLVYITRNRINLRFFELVLIGAYIYYYFSYYRNLQFVADKNVYDGDVFVTSSSNAISICLNCILFLYFILNKYYNERNQFRILLFSIFNLVFIVIQESRGGVIVAILLTTMILYDMYSYKHSLKKSYLSIAFIIIIIIGLFSYYSTIVDYFVNIGLESSSMEDNARSFAQIQFFHKMDTKTFFLGYGKGQFFEDLDRTFNSYLDLWNRYGFFSFCFFVGLFVRRFALRNSFSIPIIFFIPIMVYALVETLFAGTLWDMFFMYMLFLSGPDTPSFLYRTSPSVSKGLIQTSK